jgi:hypothetical protein
MRPMFRPDLTLRVGVVAALACAAPIAAITATAASARAHTSRKAAAAQASISHTSAAGIKVTVTGRVHLAHNTAAQRARTRVVITARTGGHSQRVTAKLGASDSFSDSWKSKLTGHLTIAAQAQVAGHNGGTAATATVTVAAPVTTTPTATTPTAGTTPMNGTFKLTAGAIQGSDTPSGSRFEMLTPKGNPLANVSEGGSDNYYTPLAPGTQGGLSTVAYQSAPTPAFQGGNALANEIVAPVKFYGYDFSVDTNPTDTQTGAKDPLPAIAVDDNGDGKLTGQVTAWDAQWNGQSFNQGTPKPGGGTPGSTTALSGTYDPTTGQFTLSWKSLIVGGPFNTFTGVWHLTGTFVPAS